jgi:hypothetical protein
MHTNGGGILIEPVYCLQARNELMSSISNTARWFPAVARLRQDAQCVADHIIIRARAAHQLGATAEAYRTSALELERQAISSERLLFGRAVATFRTAAAENRLIADALDIIESRG